MTLTRKFKLNPLWFYAFSICATWANAGSLLNGVTMARGKGILPFLLWAAGNTLACIVFGLLAPKIPKLRDVFRTKAAKIVVGLMCPFQCWISMNGIQTVFADTPLGYSWGVGIALAIGLVFIAVLWTFGVIRNVLTDHISWVLVYALVFGLSVASLIIHKGPTVELSLGAENVGSGVKNAILLIPGAFLYPYYFELLDYNEVNEDGTARVNMPKAFVFGGVAFGIYLIFIYLMALTELSPAGMILRAILVTFIAMSSLSSFLFSIYLTFGRKLGLAINIATVGLWQFLIPLGVMGAWTLMASIRIYIVGAAILAAVIWNCHDRRKRTV